MNYKAKLILIVLILLLSYIYWSWQEPVVYVKELSLIGWRIITAYNSLEEQTDDRPCEGALMGIDFCKTNQNIVATNELPLGSVIMINGERYLVADRTNSRYKYRYDILHKSYEEAKNFGRKTLLVYQIK